MNNFPGQVFSSAEVEWENAILAEYGFGVREPVSETLASRDEAEVEVPKISGVLGGFSITMAESASNSGESSDAHLL